ncbi:MAG: ion transporter [Saprospiraceae bacterium]|nr:ion transporter [Saprospiraceae bacterium]
MKDVLGKHKLKQKPTGFSPFREKLHEIIFEAETPEGRLFDLVLLVMILLSIIVLMLETVPSYYARYGEVFRFLEWFFTIFFTLEYILRIYSVYSPRYYLFSYFGIIDLLSILPSYLTLIYPGLHSLMIIRGLRLMRVFRIFKLDSFIDQGNYIIGAIIESRKKLTIFAFSIIIVACVFGSFIYLIEHKVNPVFDSIPRSIYWTIVTITTVGYGDISPITTLGQFLASIIMLMGYIIIAVPTGIVTSSLIHAGKKEEPKNTITCPNCAREGHRTEAEYCDACGHSL